MEDTAFSLSFIKYLMNWQPFLLSFSKYLMTWQPFLLSVVKYLTTWRKLHKSKNIMEYFDAHEIHEIHEFHEIVHEIQCHWNSESQRTKCVIWSVVQATRSGLKLLAKQAYVCVCAYLLLSTLLCCLLFLKMNTLRQLLETGLVGWREALLEEMKEVCFSCLFFVLV